ncbi:MAG: hypothetical protein HUJ65_07325 [Oscillospiraceae bacterium]|nr:hypothetical protein [Oscillospiraceae bacterium]
MVIIRATAAVLAAVCVFLSGLLFPRGYTPAADEIAVHLELDTQEDIGLLFFSYTADGRDYGGGISNADGSMIKPGDDLVWVINRGDLGSEGDSVGLTVRFGFTTEYVTPNFENVYPEDITVYVNNTVSRQLRFGAEYYVTITGGGAGYTAALTEP